MRIALRGLAVATIVVAAVDPGVTLTTSVRPRVAIIVDDPSSTAAAAARERLTRQLASTCDVVSAVDSDAAAAVVIGDRYPDRRLTGRLSSFTGPVSTVTLAAPKVTLARVDGPREVPAATMIRLEVDVDARGAVGESTDLVARMSGVEVARASHTWSRAAERWHTTLTVAPFGNPPFLVSVAAGGSRADLAVARRSRPFRVMAYDARPSWASTFTRRAIEHDSRFQVESIVVTSRGASTRTAGAVSLGDTRLDEFDLAIIGGIAAVTAPQWRALDRFMRIRGGAVVLLPDERTLGTVALDFIRGGAGAPMLTERLLDRPTTLQTVDGAPLQASELLLPPSLGVDVLASVPGGDEPIVVTLPRGGGRLLFSGAMDGWRFRGATDRGFDRFWQSTLARLALGAPPPLDISVTPPALQPGQAAEIVVRAMTVTAATRVEATVDDRPIRLWPDAERGVYRGNITASASPRRMVVRAFLSSDGTRSAAETIVLVDAGVEHPSDSDVAPLALLASSHGGIDVDADRTGDVARFLRDRLTPSSASRALHPSRSAWWIVPLTLCLSVEWWLRRRRGLR